MFWRSRTSSGKSAIQLENENKQLQLNILTLTDQLENFKRISFKYQEEYNKLVKKIQSFCLSLLSEEYAKNQLGGHNPLEDMDIFSLIDYAEQYYRNNNIKQRNLLIDLTNQLKAKEQEIESLKAQISRYMLKEQQMKEFGFEQGSEKQEQMPADSLQTAVQENQAPKSSVFSQPSSQPSSSGKSAPTEPPKGVRVAIFEDDEEDVAEVPLPVSNTKPAQQQQSTQKDLKPAESPIIITRAQSSQNESKSGGIKAHVIDLNDYMSKMNDIMWEIVVAIGKDGLSESKDLKKVVVKDNITESAFNTALSQLRKMGVVNQERINTGWRWFHAYELSELGTRLYVEKFKQEPVPCEKQILQREHTTALHGYCIKDAAYILQTVLGYDEAVTDRKMNSMKLYNGEVYIPDIIAKKKQGAIIDYFEVELGHHTQKDFNNKCDKMRMVTKDMYFIVPDADVMNKILAKQIGQWVLEKGGKDKLKGTTIYLTTMTKLSEGKWDNIYPF